MHVTKICRDNADLIMNASLIMNVGQKLKKRDTEFLDALWQYVLFSKSVSRCGHFVFFVMNMVN